MLIAGCGADEAGDSGAEQAAGMGEPASAFSSPRAADLDAGAGFGVEGGEADMAEEPVGPPELEEVAIGERPQVTAHYVYVLDPEAGRVVRIQYADPGAAGRLDDSPDLRVIRVGDNPHAAAALPGEDAVVLLARQDEGAVNEGEVVVIASSPAGDVIRRAGLKAAYTHLKLGPEGRLAIAYYDQNPGLTAAGGPAPADVVPQVAAIDIAGVREGRPDAVREYAVGARVTNVIFAAEGRRAFVVTRQTIHIVDADKLATEPSLETLPIEGETYTKVPSREALATPDGRLIFIRGLESRTVRVADTTAGAWSDWTLPAIPTDLDITADGAMLVAVLRKAESVVTVPILAGALVEAEMREYPLPGRFVGQAELSPGGDVALLFTSVENREEAVRLDLATGAITGVSLSKAVAGIRFAPQGGFALIRERPVTATAENDPAEKAIDALHGFALYDLGTGMAPERLTKQALGEHAFTGDGTHFAILTNEAGGPAVQIAGLQPLAFAGEILLPSAPLFLGTLPDSARVYVAVAHPYGRMVFADLATAQVATITGYVLNSEIE